MRQSHSSIAVLLMAVALFAIGLSCLLSASSPWAGLAFSALMITLTVAPLIAIYRLGKRRSFWLGVSICGLSYVVLSYNFGFSEQVSPRLVTTKLLQWAYPRVIPEGRRLLIPQSKFSISGRSHTDQVKGLDKSTVDQGFVDILVEEAGSGTSSLVGNVRVLNSSIRVGAIPSVTVLVDSAQLAKLTQARAEGRTFAIGRPVGGASVGTSPGPPVKIEDFIWVGHAFIGLICAGAGGLVGRYLYSTRELLPEES
jgi:hypothetical protein